MESGRDASLWFRMPSPNEVGRHPWAGATFLTRHRVGLSLLALNRIL
jgi:hypothetical protein